MISKANRLLISILDHLPRIIPCAVQYSQGILCSALVCACVCGVFSPIISLYLCVPLFFCASLCVLACRRGSTVDQGLARLLLLERRTAGCLIYCRSLYNTAHRSTQGHRSSHRITRMRSLISPGYLGRFDFME